MKKILLDTGAYASLLAGDENVLKAMANASQIYMSTFVLAELHFGFQGTRQRRRNSNILQCFLKKPGVRILNATFKTAEVFSQLKRRLIQAHALLPINTVLIAAHGIETDSYIVSYDKHFNKISDVKLWDRSGGQSHLRK